MRKLALALIALLAFAPSTQAQITITPASAVDGSGVVTTPLLAPNGEAAAPSYSFGSAGNTDNGMFLSASDVLGWSAAGTQRLTLSATALTSAVVVRSKQDIGSVVNWDNGQFVIQGATDVNKGVSIGFSTTDNYGYVYSRQVGTTVLPLLLNPGGGNVGINLTNATLPTQNALQLADSKSFGWSSVSLWQGAANILEQRNGANAQQFWNYRTYTDASNYARGGLTWSGNTFLIQNRGAGAVSGGDIFIDAAASSEIAFGTNGTTHWAKTAAGHLITGLDNTYDIGASGATRPRSLYVGTNGTFGGGLGVGVTPPGAGEITASSVITGSYLNSSSPTTGFQLAGIASMTSGGATGVVVMSNWAGIDFTRLILGTNDASGIGITKSGTTMEFVLGNNSDYIDVRGAAGRFTSVNLGANLNFSATAPTISSGFGTTPTIAGTATAFTVNVGTGGTASSGVIALPAAVTGWIVTCINITNAATLTVTQTAGSTTTATIASYSRTTGLLTAFTASDVLRCTAVAY